MKIGSVARYSLREQFSEARKIPWTDNTTDASNHFNHPLKYSLRFWQNDQDWRCFNHPDCQLKCKVNYIGCLYQNMGLCSIRAKKKSTELNNPKVC